MSRTPEIFVVTANALLEGAVVFLTADDRWSRSLVEAEILTDEAHAQIRLLDASVRQGEVVGPYLAEVVLGPDGPRPKEMREKIRLSGPTSKTTETSHVHA